MRPLVDERTYAAFLLSTLSLWARDSGGRSAFFGLPLEAIRLGRPDARSLVAHFGRWILPRSLRQSLKARSLPLPRTEPRRQ
jgi:hypothetical protein